MRVFSALRAETFALLFSTKLSKWSGDLSFIRRHFEKNAQVRGLTA